MFSFEVLVWYFKKKTVSFVFVSLYILSATILRGLARFVVCRSASVLISLRLYLSTRILGSFCNSSRVLD